MKRNLLIAGGVVLALVVSFVGGRYSIPPSKTTETTAAAKQNESHVDAKIETDTKTTEGIHRTIKRRTAPALPPSAPVAGICPACPAVQEETIEEDIGMSIDQDQHANVHVDAKSAETITKSKTTETESRPRFRLAVSLPPRYPVDPRSLSAEGDVRLFGTLWLGAQYVHTDKTPFRVVVGFEF